MHVKDHEGDKEGQKETFKNWASYGQQSLKALSMLSKQRFILIKDVVPKMMAV